MWNSKRSLYSVFLLAILLVGALSMTSFADDDILEWTTNHESITDLLTEEEIAMMQDQDVYMVAYRGDFVPLSYVNDAGEVVGSAVDALNMIGEALGISFEYIEMSEVDSGGDSADIYLTMKTVEGGLSNRSISYYSLPYVIVHNNEYDTSEELSLGILEYFELSKQDITSIVGAADIRVYSDFEEMNEAYDLGEIQSMLLNSARYNHVKHEIDDEDYTVEILDSTYECCFYYSSGFSEEKIDVINILIEAIDIQVLNYSILEHSTYEAANTSIVDVIKASPIRMLQMLFVFLAILLGVVAVIILQYERKTKIALSKILRVDSITGLGTLHYFEEEALRLLKEEPEKQYTILSIDIDNFKYINEIYGHAAGTEVLRKLGIALKEEASELTILARTYGDNFLVLIETQYVTPQYIEGVRDFFGVRYSKMNHGLGINYQFSFSVGYYHIPDRNLDISYMINCARLARDKGKGTVGCTVYEFTPEMAAIRSANNQVVATMDQGIKQKEFVVYYQPKIDMTTNEMNGAEALVRWNQDGKLVPPGAFIPIFEKNGFIETLDYYVLGEVCAFIRKNQGRNIPVISVNISAVTLIRKNVVERVTEIVEHHKIQPSQIELEITESAFVEKFNIIVERVSLLREAGFTISMDDFGVGISNLNQLKNIPLDILKIDRGFVVDSLKTEKGAVVATHIVGMAQELNLKTVVEGIETHAQLEFFKMLHCDIGQGYYFSRPLPEEEFVDFIESK